MREVVNDDAEVGEFLGEAEEIGEELRVGVGGFEDEMVLGEALKVVGK